MISNKSIIMILIMFSVVGCRNNLSKNYEVLNELEKIQIIEIPNSLTDSLYNNYFKVAKKLDTNFVLKYVLRDTSLFSKKWSLPLSEYKCSSLGKFSYYDILCLLIVTYSQNSSDYSPTALLYTFDANGNLIDMIRVMYSAQSYPEFSISNNASIILDKGNIKIINHTLRNENGKLDSNYIVYKKSIFITEYTLLKDGKIKKLKEKDSLLYYDNNPKIIRE